VLGPPVPVLTVGVSAAVAGADVVAVAVDAAVVAAVVMLVLATTELYCCISITAASSRTWIFLRHLILASTLLLSVPSISLSSASDIPEKLGGGWGGGTVKGTKGKGGGNMKGDLAPVEPDPGVAPAAPAAVG